MELDELRRMKTEFESAASNVESSIHENLQKQKDDVTEAWSMGASASRDLASAAEPGMSDGKPWRDGSAPPKRKNWACQAIHHADVGTNVLPCAARASSRAPRGSHVIRRSRCVGQPGSSDVPCEKPLTGGPRERPPSKIRAKALKRPSFPISSNCATASCARGIAVIVVFVGLVYWAPDIFRLLARPLMQNLPKDGKMIVTDITGSFFVPMKVTMLVAFVIALPIVLYQVWAFVAPGLYQHEKKLVMPLVASSYTLFLFGMAFAYFIVFPTIFRVMAHYNAPLGAEMNTDIDNYLSFAMTTFIAFGVTFEVPIVVVLLVRTGLVTVAKLRQIRPYVIVGAFVISAVVTPPDVFSQLILAIPLIVLYEAGIIAARLMVGKAAPVVKEGDEAAG